jgi:hypothetical protein
VAPALILIWDTGKFASTSVVPDPDVLRIHVGRGVVEFSRRCLRSTERIRVCEPVRLARNSSTLEHIIAKLESMRSCRVKD